ncbi:hypothetical protein VNO78_12250 [Psophocarpus tetragonolobus]|uniref:Uncharacterized protein n=1 Tax=Psophocarpus tetragonolobus TaxID=3891 RepID=A0AAN9SQM2_PSOTE
MSTPLTSNLSAPHSFLSSKVTGCIPSVVLLLRTRLHVPHWNLPKNNHQLMEGSSRYFMGTWMWMLQTFTTYIDDMNLNVVNPLGGKTEDFMVAAKVSYVVLGIPTRWLGKCFDTCVKF